jgi:hypothetical protein
MNTNKESKKKKLIIILVIILVIIVGFLGYLFLPKYISYIKHIIKHTGSSNNTTLNLDKTQSSKTDLTITNNTKTDKNTFTESDLTNSNKPLTDDYSFESNKTILLSLANNNSYLHSYYLLKDLGAKEYLDELFIIMDNKEFKYLPYKNYTNDDLMNVINKILNIQGKIDKLISEKNLDSDYILAYPDELDYVQHLIYE